jgi:4-amino-4-deoxychorismate lyase
MKVDLPALLELESQTVLQRLRDRRPSGAGPHGAYLAMYSSWFGGITTDPALMSVPIDDHMVHRGDAVFEAIKCLSGGIYGLQEHIDRLFISAEKIGLQPPYAKDVIVEICRHTAGLAGERDTLLRLYVSRGPGGFTTDPYESVGAQFYLVITAFKPVPEEKYLSGVSVRLSQVPVKEGFFATVKSCNYLPNVLMKKEARDWQVDFTVSRDESGHIAESSTENFAIIDRDGVFVLPGFDRILKGITAVRTMFFAEQLVKSGKLAGVKNASITLSDVYQAREAMMLGTTLDVLPVRRFEDHEFSVPGGANPAGLVAPELLTLMRADLKSGPLVTKTVVSKGLK